MKKLVLVFAVLGLLSLSFMPNTAGCNLKYTGIYKADLNEKEAIYIRFFKDGTVLHTSSITDEKRVYKMLLPQFADQMLSGKFYQRGCSFSAEVKHGKVKVSVKGMIQEDVLLITMKDKLNGETLDKQFEYFEMEEED